MANRGPSPSIIESFCTAQWQAEGVTDDARHGLLLRRWGRFVARHARWVLAFWVAFIGLGFGVALGAFGTPSVFDRLHSGAITTPGEAQTGLDILTEAGGSGFNTYTLTVEGVDLASPQVAKAGAEAVRTISAIPHVKSAVNPFVIPTGPTSPQALAFVKDGQLSSGGYATTVTYSQGTTKEQEAAAQKDVDAAFDTLVRDSGASSSGRGGVKTLVDAVISQVRTDLKTGEGIALPISFLVMVLVFGGFVAAGLPLIGAIASIAGALASLLGFSYFLDLDASVVNVITVLGLGLCIDYGLLMVSRFREELTAAQPEVRSRTVTPEVIQAATEHAMDRAGRTVIFSGVTVALSLGGLLVFSTPFVRAIGAAGVSIVVVALAVGLSLVPALCVLAGRNLARKAPRQANDSGIFATLAQWVHRRPWLVIVGVSALLIAAALPTFSMRLTSSGAELLPTTNAQRQFFQALRADYPKLGGSDVAIVTKAPLSEVQAFVATAAKIPGVQSVDPPREVGSGVVTLSLHTGDGGLGDDSRAVVEHLHTERTPFESWTIGQAAGLSDFTSSVVARAPLAIGLVALATLVLLFLMTGSVVIPLKALAMNVVSLGACLGIVVWIFQEGHLEGLLDYSSVGAVEHTIPLLVLAFGFGLSMDYEVFLLSRIVELHEQGVHTTRAVTLGLQRSGRIITSAAILMIIVFSGFSAGKMLTIKEMGLALCIAIAVDATLVRMLLVPATMSVLGKANWWAPAPLKRLHARWGITE